MRRNPLKSYIRGVFALFVDDRTMRLNPEGAPEQFGTYVGTIGQDLRGNNARVMQFSLRYEF